jgi:starch synthase
MQHANTALRARTGPGAGACPAVLVGRRVSLGRSASLVAPTSGNSSSAPRRGTPAKAAAAAGGASSSGGSTTAANAAPAAAPPAAASAAANAAAALFDKVGRSAAAVGGGNISSSSSSSKGVMSSNGNGSKAASAAAKPASSTTTTSASTAGGKRPSAPPPTALRNLVFVTSEVAPWSKTGGLGDVMGSLPAALAARGHRVMVVAPRYAEYPEAGDTGVRHVIPGGLAGGEPEVGYYHHSSRGVDYIFVDHPSYPRPGGFYADANGAYGDNQFRFSLLCLAALEAPLVLPLVDKAGSNDKGSSSSSSSSSSTKGDNKTLYGQECVFVANDWHAALVPVYLAAKYRPHGVYNSSRSVVAIHNLRHQGVFPPGSFKQLGLPGEWYPAVEYQYPPHQRTGPWAEEGRSVNLLKAGVAVADRLVTVSPGYAHEVTTWLGGWGLEGLLAARSPVLSGIVNGIEEAEWDPSTDRDIARNYSASSLREGKAANKRALQRELGLPEDPDAPLLAFIGRLDYQKGADLILQAAPWIMQQGCQLVCLGSGTPDLEGGLRWLEAAYPDQARGWVGFNVALSHRITAAADMLLMPSRFEPCGLNQLYAMAYGTVPIAHKTGGLADTVVDFDPFAEGGAKGTGWTFSTCDAAGLIAATGHALQTYREHRDEFDGIALRGMARDSSWEQAASQYEQVFEWALMDPPYAR